MKKKEKEKKKKERYCLDTNIFIEPWNKFYSPKLTKNYWKVLEDFFEKDIIFSTAEVKREIEKVDDDLSKWTKANKKFFKDIDTDVQKKLREIMKKYEKIIDNTKGRSIADPLVIAHAQSEEATVVTFEQKATKPEQIKIPDVCQKEDIRCIDLYTLLEELKIEFKVKIRK